MITIHIEQSMAYSGTRIWICKEHKNEPPEVAEPIELKFKKTEYGAFNEPTLTFNRYEGTQFLEEFAKALISAGFRDKATDNSGEIKRLEDHNNDLKKIVFKQLKIEQ